MRFKSTVRFKSFQPVKHDKFSLYYFGVSLRVRLSIISFLEQRKSMLQNKV